MKLKRFMSLVLAATVFVSAISIALNANPLYKVNAASYNEYTENIKSSNYATQDITISDEKVMLTKDNNIEYKFSIEDSALYALKIGYTTVKENSERIELDVLLDGAVPFAEAQAVDLYRYYSDDGSVRTDDRGNESYAYVKEIYGQYEHTLVDDNNAKYLYFEIKKGEHILSFRGISGTVIIHSVTLVSKVNLISYKDYIKQHNDDYSGEQIVFEAEG